MGSPATGALGDGIVIGPRSTPADRAAAMLSRLIMSRYRVTAQRMSHGSAPLATATWVCRKRLR
jgi:hypothetical protein